MAQQGVALDQSEICYCSICLELLKEPVTLPCGHSYCRSCIEGCWDRDEEKRVYKCPQCRESFSPRPALRKNHMLAEVVEKLMPPGGQQRSPSAALVYAGPDDVACDSCTGTRRHKALMSCLTCLASYCDAHLQPHYKVPTWKEHKLVPATNKLQDKMCSSHAKLMEVYCRTDQQCICYLCTMDDHKGHDTVSVAAARADKQKLLVASQQKVQRKIQGKKDELRDLRKAMGTLKSSAVAAVDASDKIFSKLIVSIERRRSEVKKLIRDQEKTALDHAEGLLRQLEDEIAKLEKRHAEMEELSNTDDITHFIQSFQPLSGSSSGSEERPGVIVVHPVRYFTHVSDVVSGLRDQLDAILKKTWPTILQKVSAVRVLLPPEPQARKDFLQYACKLTLDPNTVNRSLLLSENNRKVGPHTYVVRLSAVRVLLPPESQARKDFLQYACKLTLDPNTVNRSLLLSENNRKVGNSGLISLYRDHPERFGSLPQTLCTEGLTGRCYWELEWHGKVYIAVTYRGTKRKGYDDCLFGCNDKSWSLECEAFVAGDDGVYGNGFTVWHNGNATVVDKLTDSNRVGVYLDCLAGTLSFYLVSYDTQTRLYSNDTLEHLYTFQSTFTEPLYPGFWVGPDDLIGKPSVSLCQIEPVPALRTCTPRTVHRAPRP